MKLTIVVTIDPVKEIRMLRLLVHSLNMQTCREFDVLFYNQTTQSPQALLDSLLARPSFRYRFCNIPEERFIGKYPVWDLYRLMADLIASGDVGEYVLALHMEEFLDAEYVAEVVEVLDAEGLDILLGNLTRTTLSWQAISPILDTTTPVAFSRFLSDSGMDQSPHWGYQRLPPLRPFRLARFRDYFKIRLQFGFRRQMPRTCSGALKVKEYLCEDVFVMRTSFARRYNWFLHGMQLPMEDIHICEIAGVCELARELKELTAFPVYFNRRRIYHVPHGRFYFQLEDPEFTRQFLQMNPDNPVCEALQEVITAYQAGQMSLRQALQHSRHNSRLTGSQDVNYRLHIETLEKVSTLGE